MTKRFYLAGLLCLSFFFSVNASDFRFYLQNLQTEIMLKTPGNDAVITSLQLKENTSGEGFSSFISEENIPVRISVNISDENGYDRLVTQVTALEDVYFNLKQNIVLPGFNHDDCLFYLPGFWYRKNLRSPENTPSWRVSQNWMVREDRLSTPLTGVFNEQNGNYFSVLRWDEFPTDAYTALKSGEVILSGETSVGFTGFEAIHGTSSLCFGFPSREAPRTYIRKLTLDPSVITFMYLPKGETKEITWYIRQGEAGNFSQFVEQVWTSCFKTYNPQPLSTTYTTEKIKTVLSEFFRNSYVETSDLNYFSGVHLRTDDCQSTGIAEIGFVGRVLLNAYNAIEYAEEINDNGLLEKGQKVMASYLKNGFTPEGYIREWVDMNNPVQEQLFSIRRQSEGLYALLHYLNYEKQKNRKHPAGEQKVKQLLDNFLSLQQPDGSFPRKFKSNGELIDPTGGSTPSATLPLVMASVYFKEKKYLESAQKTAAYLEKEIISKADYFSSTLDADCEDKEASIYAATALYYLALVTKGKEAQYYTDLCKKASYFAMSWYYLWDVPFARGQMLGDIGLKTRGWGNVSVENNHVDVFIFEFADVLDWLTRQTKEPCFNNMSQLIRSSMFQLLPYDGHLCGIAKTGYYPEVVQHTNWDYGKNGKGFYNDIFAPGWTIASLWELLSPYRAEHFLVKH